MAQALLMLWVLPHLNPAYSSAIIASGVGFSVFKMSLGMTLLS